MSRTVCYIPTSLSRHDLDARLEMFLHYHKFRKMDRRGEELYRVNHWFLGSGYLKIVPQNGFVRLEAFYVNKHDWEFKTDFPFDKHHMREKFMELSKVIGTGPPTNIPPVPGQQPPYPPESNPSYASDPWQEDANSKRPPKKGCLKGCLMGCLIAVLVFICLFAGLIFLALMFPSPDSPVAKTQQVGTLGWKTLEEKRYSLRYPKDWEVYTNKDNSASAEDKPKAETKIPFRAKRWLSYLITEYTSTAEEQQPQEEIPETTAAPRPRFNRYVLLKESSDGDVYASVADRENSGLYDELTEENFMAALFADEDYRGFTRDVFEKETLKDKRALFALYTGELAEKKTKIYYWLSENGDTILTIWFVANNADYEKLEPVFDTIISTLKLR